MPHYLLADTKVQALFEVDEGVTPNALTDIGARQNFSAAAQKEFENLERLRRQLDAVAPFAELAGAGIELE